MKMSLEYMQQSADLMSTHGYALTVERVDYGDESLSVPAVRFVLRRDRQHLVLETVQHPDVGERYFAEIVHFHGLHANSFELDSWKHRDDRIELKFQARDDGSGGLAFVLSFVEHTLRSC